MKRVQGAFPEAVEASIWHMAVLHWERTRDAGYLRPPTFAECVATATAQHVNAMAVIHQGLPIPDTEIILIARDGRLGFDQPG